MSCGRCDECKCEAEKCSDCTCSEPGIHSNGSAQQISSLTHLVGTLLAASELGAGSEIRIETLPLPAPVLLEIYHIATSQNWLTDTGEYGYLKIRIPSSKPA
jgi:hypothetical protein